MKEFRKLVTESMYNTRSTERCEVFGQQMKFDLYATSHPATESGDPCPARVTCRLPLTVQSAVAPEPAYEQTVKVLPVLDQLAKAIDSNPTDAIHVLCANTQAHSPALQFYVADSTPGRVALHTMATIPYIRLTDIPGTLAQVATANAAVCLRHRLLNNERPKPMHPGTLIVNFNVIDVSNRDWMAEYVERGAPMSRLPMFEVADDNGSLAFRTLFYVPLEAIK